MRRAKSLRLGPGLRGMEVAKQSEAPSSPTDLERRRKKQDGCLTARAVLLALLLAVVNDYWIVQLEVARNSFPTYAAPFYNVIFTLLVLTVLNVPTKRLVPSLALCRGELLVIYVMLSVTSAVCSHNMMQILVSMMGYPFYFQNASNDWSNLFLNQLPQWLTVSDPVALRNFYLGGSTLYLPENFLPWLVPAAWWSLFCAVLLFTTLCLVSILRKHWIESERLTFPIIMLPLEMTDPSGKLFRNRYFWLGFAIAGSITMMAALNYLYPNIPCLSITRINIGGRISAEPWQAMGKTMMGFYLWAIGIAYLMPLDLSFSCWLFYWLIKLELVTCHLAGILDLRSPGTGFDNSYPYLNSQSYGAYLGFFALSMWSGRKFFGRVLRTALRGTREVDESNEPVSYRTSVVGFILGSAFLAAFASRIGISVPVIVIFFMLYFVFAVICSRIRAELGFPIHDAHMMSPQYPILTAAGTQHLGRQDLVGLSMLWWFNRTYASHPSPHQIESMKIAERSQSPAGQMFKAVLVAGIAALPIGFWMLLHIYFIRGGATSNMNIHALNFGRDFSNELADRMLNNYPTNTTSIGFVLLGLIGSLAMGWARTQYVGFPLHPLAYAIGNSWGVAQLWMPLMIGSVAKFVMLRFGGLQTYRKSLPFFFGLILGEITIGSLWTLIGIYLDIPTYDFWPGRPR